MSEALSGMHVCRVCGDRASGIHYGVMCCEGCKGFFFRTIRCNKRYRACDSPGLCLILRSNRSGCKFCRMQRCLELGMSYEAVKMGRRSKTQHSRMKTSMVIKRRFQDDFTISIYSAFTKARNLDLMKNNINKDLNSIQNIQCDDSSFLRNGIVFSTAFAKHQALFTRFPSPVRHSLIKTAVIEMCVLADSIRTKTGDNFTVDYCRTGETVNGVTVMAGLRDKGKNLIQKLLCLQLTPVELSLLFALILYCSDRPSLDSDICERIGCIEESILSALKYQLLMNHNKHMNILIHIIEILCSLRALTAQYLDDLLSFDTL